MTLQVVSANRLDNGLAVFYGKEDQWHTDIDKAVAVEGKEAAEELLNNASTDKNQLVIVGPYLVEVEKKEDSLVPVRYREKIRTQGPSVRPDLGYQAK